MVIRGESQRQGTPCRNLRDQVDTGRYTFGTIENIPSIGKSYVGTKFRIVVE